MSMSDPLGEAVQQNAIVLASVGDLISSVVIEVAGNEISTAVSGQTLTRESIQILVNQEILENLK